MIRTTMFGFIIAAQAAGRKGHRTRHTFILRSLNLCTIVNVGTVRSFEWISYCDISGTSTMVVPFG